ncbi:MAG TPA: extracellular solute-binding protein [Fimbriimonadaceae bacterium]|nr:extracellular solute-binding protein [Fimbriimonadaceae bacterium]
MKLTNVRMPLSLNRRLLLCLVLLPILALAPSTVPAAEQVTLRFTVWDGDESLKVLRRLTREFERLNPHIKVKLENFSDYNMYHQKMLVQYAANVAPDVAMMDMPNFRALARRGAILPLNPFFAQTPGFYIEEYYEPIVRAHSYEGNVYVLPRDIAPMGLIYYNKRLFKEAGIPEPDGSWTWDFEPRPELREKCFTWVMQQLTKKGPDGKVRQWAMTPGWPELLAQTFMWSYGGQPVDDLENPTRITMDDPKVIKTYQFASDLMNKQKFVPSQAEITGLLQSSQRDLFVQQKVAMFQCGIWEVPNIRRDLKPGAKNWFEWDITLFPAYKDGTRAAPTGGSGYAIFSSTPHPKEAWELVRFMAGPVGMQAMAEAGIAQPAIEKLALSEPWIPGPNTPPELKYPHNRMATHLAVPFVKFGSTSDVIKEPIGLASRGLDLLWNGATTAEKELKQNAPIANERLRELLTVQRLPVFNWGWGLLIGLLIAGGIALWIYLPERGKKVSQRQRKENRTALLFISPWLVGLLIFTLGPMILSLLMSFADWDIITDARNRAVGNYVEAFTRDPRFWKSLTVTFLYTIFSVPVGLVGSLLLALLMNQRVRGIPLFRTFYYIPSLASMVAASLIWRKIFATDGLLNNAIYGTDGKGNLFGLATLIEKLTGQSEPFSWLTTENTALPALIVMSIWGIGGGMVILLAGLQGIPQHYYEAATLDGAGILKKFRNVTLPLLTPTIFFSLVTGFIGSFQVFTQAFVMTQGGPNDATMFYMFHLYGNAFQSLRMGYASALAWVLFVIIMVATLAQFRFSKWVYYEAEAK